MSIPVSPSAPRGATGSFAGLLRDVSDTDDPPETTSGPSSETENTARAFAPEVRPFLQELTHMTDMLSASDVSSAMPPLASPLTAVVRLVSGLDLLRWREISASGLCEGWFALDITDDMRENLSQNLRSALEQGLRQEHMRSSRDPDVPSASIFPSLAVLRASALTSGPEKEQDDTTEMLNTASFQKRLTEATQRARREGSTLSLVLFEAEWQSDTDAMRMLADRIELTARPQDVLGRLQPDLLALVLPGVGHFQALALAEKIVSDVCRRLGLPSDGVDMPHGEALSCRLRAGCAELPDKRRAQTEESNVLAQARQALAQASRATDATVRERVRLFRQDVVPVERETLVLASEKQFLFFGV